MPPPYLLLCFAGSVDSSARAVLSFWAAVDPFGPETSEWADVLLGKARWSSVLLVLCNSPKKKLTVAD